MRWFGLWSVIVAFYGSNDLSLCVLMSSVDKRCLRFVTKSGKTEGHACSGAKPIDTLMVSLK